MQYEPNNTHDVIINVFLWGRCSMLSYWLLLSVTLPFKICTAHNVIHLEKHAWLLRIKCSCTVTHNEQLFYDKFHIWASVCTTNPLWPHWQQHTSNEHFSYRHEMFPDTWKKIMITHTRVLGLVCESLQQGTTISLSPYSLKCPLQCSLPLFINHHAVTVYLHLGETKLLQRVTSLYNMD